jgi:hypothetical protein
MTCGVESRERMTRGIHSLWRARFKDSVEFHQFFASYFILESVL